MRGRAAQAWLNSFGRIDLAELKLLFDQKDDKRLAARGAPHHLVAAATEVDAAKRRQLQRARRGSVAAGDGGFLVVAGGQGSRLGFDHPKGMFPIGPMSRKTLFQFHAEKVAGARRRYGSPCPSW